MRYTIAILVLLPFIFSCKSKKHMAETNKPIKDTFYVINHNNNQLEMIINDGKTNPDGEWVLQSIDGKHDDEMQRVTLEIKSGSKTFSGNDGCNSYMGDLKNYDGRTMEFVNFSKTERECIIPARFAKPLYDRLEKINYFFANKKHLILGRRDAETTSAKGRLQFVRKNE